ncbi:homoserine dehydrogenase [Paludisphaera mucosa]|uniref:Homoserine dehydrogenase n=1 Tax=Paludisphaera mucosa TaxID=3030827 RepID=A0ABT6F555_9BACT|nr:homoserine dehydrogenase [Paludisphaera mucosa]MDG3002657.1 homoserine dehydrogenase [Paludisphaera mucosa]
MQQVSVGLVGLGTVGAGVARILTQHADRIARRAGSRIDCKWAVVRDLNKKDRRAEFEGVRIVDDVRRVIDDPEVAIVVELIGGIDAARRIVLDALAAGKHVVTANKALLAEHGPEVFAAARAADRAVAFEASAGGGVPIVGAINVGLAANQVQSLAAILNGTCNYILTQMTQEGIAYDAALAGAQALGYAEADPTLDVDGTDTAHKLAILAQLAFRANVKTADIPREGIDRLDLADLKYARELGYTIKLLAHAKLAGGALELRVAPSLVRNDAPLAQVHGPYNAVRVVGDAVGDTFFHGRGAGMMPTASAVVADLIDVATGRALLTSRVLDFWSAASPAVPLLPSSRSLRRNYLRFLIADRPGVIAAIAQILGARGISIASVIQHEPAEAVGDEPGPVPLVIMTHLAVEEDLREAIREIDGLDVVRAPSVRLGVEE